jgi:hypothetical protein
MLVDNWDNLSSKTIISDPPDFITTWGPQSASHATQIQGISVEKVVPIGAPRFEDHFSYQQDRIANFAGTPPYILYCGTSLYSHEERNLDSLDGILEKIGSPVMVRYRPHPLRLKGLRPSIRNQFGHITSEGPLALSQGQYLSPSPYPPESGLAEQLANCQFALGGLTSVLLEAELHQKRYIAFANREKYNLLSPKTVFEEYTHFVGIADLSHLTICSSLRDLPDLVDEHLRQTEIPQQPRDDVIGREFFLAGNGSSSYGQRLNQMIHDVLD